MSIPTRLFSGACEISTGAFTPSNTSAAFQGEAQAISVQVDFTQNGEPYDIPADVTVYRYLYYDAQASHTTAIAMEKNGSAASALLTEQEQSLPGTPYLCITMLDAEGNKIVSFATRIEIQRLLGKTLINTLPPEALEAAIAAANIATAKANIAADRAELAALNPPIPTEDNTWAVWDSSTEAYVDTGKPSALPGEEGKQGEQGPPGDPTTATASDISTSTPGVSVQEALDSIGTPTAADILYGEDGDTVEDALDEHSAKITDFEARTAEDIPTSDAGVSVQAALDGHTSEIASLYPDIATISLTADGWVQNGDFFEQTASHGIFAEDGYIYDPAPVPARIFDVAGFGGIVLAEPIADSSAIFQCPNQPGVDIDMQIRRMPQKEDA